MKNVILKLTFYYLLITNSNIFAHPYTSPDTWQNKNIQTFLENTKILSKEPMQEYLKREGKIVEFNGNVSLVTLENGIKGVFKAFNKDDYDDAYAEVAAYEFSVFLGFPYVPPTVLRTIDNQKGSLQLFVETKYDLLQPNEYKEILNEIKPEDKTALKLFYFIFGQNDTGPHNMVAYKDDNKTYLIAIDNSAIKVQQYVEYGELAYVRVTYDKTFDKTIHQSFPFSEAKVMIKPDIDKLKYTFNNKLPDSFYKNFKSYGLPFKYVIYQQDLWRQAGYGNESFVKNYVNEAPGYILDKLAKLNHEVLVNIFCQKSKPDFVTSDYLKNIIERRDQVLKYFNY